MCKCIEKIDKEKLKGYAGWQGIVCSEVMNFKTNKSRLVPTITAKFIPSNKDGSVSSKKERTTYLIPRFCPFCGVEYLKGAI